MQITFWKEEHVQKLLDAGALPHLVTLMGSTNMNVLSNVFTAIKNIAFTCSPCLYFKLA